ncbi:hypothetical protein RB195_025410 [Necator americanus]|uniref:C2H2-type domain-containing protein n=1 Tax=Necator americanus TaxID=51031 RepID=A0ABR1ES62_NECAM
MQTSTSAPCSICSKGPFLIQNLYKHLRNVHKCSEDQVEEVKSAVKRAVYAEEIKCDTCGRVFFSAYGMRKHKKNVHGNNAASTSAASEANIDDDSDLEEQTRSILGTDRRLLQTCFVCGRRNPEENDENEVFWVSCSNTAVCKAWSHILCCTGVGSQCSICKAGHWRLEEV